MTTYEKQLVEMVEQRCGELAPREVIQKLIQVGVVDYSRCKVLAVREYVDTRVKNGEKKIDAMWQAAERFVCTYEYIRKCVYYYTDVNW